ncbi:amidohydrolase/deacetylase family metallohydrolase [Verminephrobacter aporrectodeae subsp. tuberculatae]|nr:amidohydrolase/deacetylase family metallohydrolase [Verminephrobacter aporrectodeae subsp. tuberculatae]MCW8170093.1 amidohydrolase/deacetylase family metallohydrolase [Verminephrobacter aporrectodeae subsp. tuberculatae]
MTHTSSSAQPLLLTNVRPVAFAAAPAGGPLDILVGTDGCIAAVGSGLPVPAGVRQINGKGTWISPGWIDLHAHVWRGGTDVSIDPSQCGLACGVTTIVDAGSAGEASFAGFREFIIEKSRERVLAFLNIGSIGLVACSRVSELIDVRSIDIDRTIACVNAHRDVIVGIKVRSSGSISGTWGLTALKIAKQVGKLTNLPLMVHIGEPPPLYDEVLDVVGPGDVITHCFNGKAGGSLNDDELIELAKRCANEGVRLDIGHGAASFSFRTAELAIQRGLLPFSISTDLHVRSLEHGVWDLATTMSKLLELGMPFEAMVNAVTSGPASVVGLPTQVRLEAGTKAEFTLFDLVDGRLDVVDAMGARATLRRIVEPRWAVLGAEALAASRLQPPPHEAPNFTCIHCGGTQKP